jgi:hypothetical protein
MLMITTRIAKSSADLNVGVFVSQLLLEALENDAGERRSEIRYPFFTPVSIQLPDRLDKPLSAFSREISSSGIGLIHSSVLKPGPVTLVVTRPKGGTRKIRTDIRWCRAAGEGWYFSGGKFLHLES